MITCNRCGKFVQSGLANCQNCGEPVEVWPASNAMGSRGDPKTVAPKQPELPAWLETLRAGDRPGPSASPNFSVTDLIEEGTFPSWMRPENGEFDDPSLSGPHPALRSSTMPAPDTSGLFPPEGGRGIAANSLIDEQSLPSWIRGQSENFPRTPADKNISASSLVQSDALPEWMRIVQPSQSEQQQPLAPPQEQTPAFPTPAAPVSPTPAPPAQWGGPIMPPQTLQGLAARDLVDQQSLPPWMTNQNGSPGTMSAMEAPMGSGQPGLPASSLIDTNSLPPWLLEPGHQSLDAGTGGGMTGMPNGQSMQPEWPTLPPAGSIAGVPGGASLAASSLIDVNALPDWLRPTVGQQQGGVPSPLPSPRQASFGPPRVENVNVRVPGRPRGEMADREQSEAAANIFASVLGVASSTPSLSEQGAPGGFGNFQGQPGLPGQGFQGGQPQYPPQQMVSQMGQLPPQQAMQQMGNAAAGMPGTQPGYAGPQPMPGYPGYGPAAYQAGYPMNGQPGVSPRPLQPPTYPPGLSPESVMADQAKQKPAKRSFLDHIRDWFSR